MLTSYFSAFFEAQQCSPNFASRCNMLDQSFSSQASLARRLTHRISNDPLPVSYASASVLRRRDNLDLFLLVTAVLFRRLPARQTSQYPVLLFQSRDFAREGVLLIFAGLYRTPELFIQFAQTALPVLVDLLCLNGFAVRFL